MDKAKETMKRAMLKAKLSKASPMKGVDTPKPTPMVGASTMKSSPMIGANTGVVSELEIAKTLREAKDKPKLEGQVELFGPTEIQEYTPIKDYMKKRGR